jgi:GH24 family phage-related lysozyme (muramidase)
MLNIATYLPQLKIFEGSIPFMYVDSTGNVTVGVGNMLPNAAAAQKLAFQRRLDARPATAADILADFNNVARQPQGQLASSYRKFTKLDLPETAIDALLQTRVTEFCVDLVAAFPDFQQYPDPVSAALFDMAFNLGMTKLTGAFPMFCAAVKRRDWATASAQCHRNGIQADRNTWAKAQFDQAAADAKAHAATK